MVLGLVLLGAALTPASDLAFSHVGLGESAPQLRLSKIGGDVENYLNLEENQINVFAFVKSNHPRSENLINNWDELQEAWADHPVHWTLIISDRHESGLPALWDSLAPGCTVLMDTGDKLYSQLGVVLTPTVGIVDTEGLLQAYLPFRKINYPTTIDAHLKNVSGMITREEMDKLLNPSGHSSDSVQAGAKRKLKLAKMLLDRGRLESALLQVENALSEYPELREGYVLLAEIHRAANRMDDAHRAEAMAAQFPEATHTQ